MGEYSYSVDELKQAKAVFDAACAKLLAAKQQLGQRLEGVDAYGACIDALLSASIDLEVIQEIMRMEGNFPLDTCVQSLSGVAALSTHAVT